MLWLKLLFRLLMIFVAPVILLIPTIYATARKLDRLPWGLDPFFGCKEDGWNGTGCDPEFPRKFWRNVDRKTMQGWYPDHLYLIWEDLPVYEQWWHGFWWCAFRNVCWNLRLTDWFGTSVHWQDIRVNWLERNDTTGEITVIWNNKKGKQLRHRRKLIFGVLLEYGYEFPYDLFDDAHPWFNRVRNEGYTFDVTPFKDRSMPSLRPR
tara:strand:+ start:4174 stop:4794 length:621 start_codon:yes stop_codon:yes gene_type:complete